jgi:hypothetical protein
MSTQFVKNFQVSMNISLGVDLVGVLVPKDKCRNKTGEVLHRNAEVYGTVNRINLTHSHKLINSLRSILIYSPTLTRLL